MTIDAALAKAAAFERDARAKHYPAMVQRREMTREEAEDDLNRWVAIARWAATGEVPLDAKTQPWEPRWIWRPLARAAAEALQRREEACRAKPGDAGLALR